MRLTGVVIDQYDDPSGYVLKQSIQPQQIPYHWKTARVLNPETLLDEEFALVLDTGEGRHRKYATADQVSTEVSTLYFLRCGGKLPYEAQKTAAINLSRALSKWGLSVPFAIEKVASGRNGGGLEEIVGRAKMLGKTANAVDVYRQEAPVVVQQRPYPTDPSLYALSMTQEIGANGQIKTASAKFPIDTMDRVMTAIEYYPRNEDNFTLNERWEYCTKVAHRAALMGIPVNEKMKPYAQMSKKGSARQLKSGLFWRVKHAGVDPKWRRMAEGIWEQSQSGLAGEQIVGMLHEFDKMAGLCNLWDKPNCVPNPVRSVYKTAACISEDMGEDDILFEGTGTRLSTRKLTEAVMRPDTQKHLYDQFPVELVEGLIKDPAAVFSSLPDPHKIIISRLANSNSDGRDTVGTYGSGT